MLCILGLMKEHDCDISCIIFNKMGFCSRLLSLVDFLQNYSFPQKYFSVIPTEWHIVSIQIRTEQNRNLLWLRHIQSIIILHKYCKNAIDHVNKHANVSFRSIWEWSHQIASQQHRRIDITKAMFWQFAHNYAWYNFKKKHTSPNVNYTHNPKRTNVDTTPVRS